jgi:hypothetical protein
VIQRNKIVITPNVIQFLNELSNINWDIKFQTPELFLQFIYFQLIYSDKHEQDELTIDQGFYIEFVTSEGKAFQNWFNFESLECIDHESAIINWDSLNDVAGWHSNDASLIRARRSRIESLYLNTNKLTINTLGVEGEAKFVFQRSVGSIGKTELQINCYVTLDGQKNQIYYGIKLQKH